MTRWAVRLWRRYKRCCLDCGGRIWYRPVWPSLQVCRIQTDPPPGLYFWCDDCSPDKHGLLAKEDTMLESLVEKEW